MLKLNRLMYERTDFVSRCGSVLMYQTDIHFTVQQNKMMDEFNENRRTNQYHLLASKFHLFHPLNSDKFITNKNTQRLD